MKPLYVYTLFDHKTNKPRCTGIKDGDRIIVLELFKGKGSGNPISKIFDRIKKIRKTLIKAEYTRPIITSDFKRHIKAFDLEYSNRKLNVYDLHLPYIKPPKDTTKDAKIVERILEKLPSIQVSEYQKILANANVVYHDLEERGIEINHQKFNPHWSTDTFSGRSKTTGTNIQGWADGDFVRPPGYDDRSVLIHFDWICADIRVAALLSGDKRLEEAFIESDPYEKMMGIINEGGTDDLSRNNCKVMLLKAINSMAYDDVVLSDIYPQLGRWIRRCKAEATAENGHLETILGRKFRTARAKNELAVLNGVMQGSVAHAMQLTLRNSWEAFPMKVVTDIHDSLVVACDNNGPEVQATISSVAKIMLNPFRGVIDSNPTFPLKVSIGRKWKQWKTVRIYRESGVENVKQVKNSKKTITPSKNETEGIEET